ARASKEKAMGQVSLFSALPDNNEFESAQFQLGGSDEEYPDKQIQQFEKEFLGFYVTSHPLFSIRKNLPFLMTHKISELKNMEEKKMATICGLITAVRKIPTKKDPSKFIIIATIEDLTDKVEIVGFNKIVQEYGDFIVSENKVIISGKVQHREEGATSLLIDSVKPVENSNLVTITLNEEMKYEELCGVKDILAKHHGSDPVLFKIPETNDKILTSSTFWVSASNDLKSDIDKIFNEKLAVTIKSMD
ncbi:MAG: OB-fold nucleic acid binding domain-containing protein, partial [Candidatus Gastranaerophilales bacterium]|nr:OB-fold nucleic acid binding domain-containing protein [Candidatus Gastranaerophilales bacterium]